MRNIKLAIDKGLIINDDTSIYDDIVYKYKYLLEYYISKVIDFTKYEKEIDDSGLYIGKNNKYKNLNNYLDLNYIFLINHLFVEKLSVDNINLLKTFDKNNISDELINLVKNTYRNVIYDNYHKNDYQKEIYKVCYGAFIPLNMVDNNVLVFKIYYGKNLKDFNGDEYIEISEKQIEFFHNLINKIKMEIKEKLNIDCEILLEKDIY